MSHTAAVMQESFNSNDDSVYVCPALSYMSDVLWMTELCR